MYFKIIIFFDVMILIDLLIDWLAIEMTQACPGFPEKRQFLVIASLTHLSPSLLAQVLI